MFYTYSRVSYPAHIAYRYRENLRQDEQVKRKTKTKNKTEVKPEKEYKFHSGEAHAIIRHFFLIVFSMKTQNTNRKTMDGFGGGRRKGNKRRKEGGKERGEGISS